MWKTRLPATKARQYTRLGRQLRHMPATEAAWQAGDIDITHVSALLAARRPHIEEDFAEHEKALVDAARTMSYKKFTFVVDYWLQAADPDGTEANDEQRRDKRSFRLSESLGGMWYGDIRLDPIAGTIVNNMLTPIERELFEADMAEARSRLGDTATANDLGRTPTQRRADALVEMAIRAGTAPADGRRPAPLLIAFVGYETFAGRICELASGRVITPGSLVSWLDEAYIERVVFDGPSRIIDVGPQRRLFTGATRRVVQLLHRECYHPSCELPATDCEIDHIQPYAHDGPTISKNGRPACKYHNNRRNRVPDDDEPDD
jgi:hypothetical protein